MTVSCGRTGYVVQDTVKLDRKVIMSMWRLLKAQPYTTGKEVTRTFWRHEHPTLDFALVRFFERENVGSWSTIARLVGEGWEISFVHRRHRGKIEEVIDFNTSLSLGTVNNFEHDWTLATLSR